MEATEKGCESVVHRESIGNTLPKVAGEKEKEWEHAHGSEQEICSPKTLIEGKERVSIPLGLYKQGSTELEIPEFNTWLCSGGKEGRIPRSRQ